MAGRRWTLTEDAAVRANARMTARDLAAKLGRTEHSVSARRHLLGVDGYTWTEEEDRFVIDNPEMAASEVGRKLDRTRHAVIHRRKVLGIKFAGGSYWTREQTDIIRNNPDVATSELAKMTGKTAHAINHKRKSLGLSKKAVHIPWTEEDDSFLAKNTGSMRSGEIASRMGRTLNSVYSRQRHLDLLKTRAEKEWKKDEIAFLKKHRDESNAWIAGRLGRTRRAVVAARVRYGLPRYDGHRFWTKEEDAILRTSMNDAKRADLYKKLPYRSLYSISARLDKLGMKRKNNRGFTYNTGYKMIYKEGMPMKEHRDIMARIVGRSLKKGEVVHHVDGDRANNDIRNLDLLPSQKAHMLAESSLNGLVKDLMDSGILGYSKQRQEYYVCGQKL